MADLIANQLLIIILCSLFLEASSLLKIPLTYFPTHKYNDSTLSNKVDNIILQRVYAIIDIGTPKASIHLPLLFGTNEFFIFNNPKNDYGENDFSDLSFYNEDKSSTNEEGEDPGVGQCCGDYFGFCYFKREVFYFNDKSYMIEFFEGYDHMYIVLPGGIGLKLDYQTHVCHKILTRERSFFDKMKKLNLINSYDWSIFFNNKEYKKEDTGFLLMGSLPHEVGSDLGYYKKENFNEKYIKKVNMEEVSTKFELDKVFAYYGTDKNNIITNFTSELEKYNIVELDYHLGGVRAPYNLLKYLENTFQNYITKGICSKDTFSDFHHYYFYCKKEIGDDLKKIKEQFPGISFQSNDLNYTFILEADDLFIEVDNYIVCLLYFESNKIEWSMGRPFLKKYLFSYNFDGKYIQFYQDIKDSTQDEDKGIPVYILIISIIGTILVVALIAFLLFKFYFYNKCLRKKRANELVDDFEYTSKDEEKKDKEDQKNTEENDKLGLNIN